jgi:hypothetical protein
MRRFLSGTKPPHWILMLSILVVVNPAVAFSASNIRFGLITGVNIATPNVAVYLTTTRYDDASHWTSCAAKNKWIIGAVVGMNFGKYVSLRLDPTYYTREIHITQNTRSIIPPGDGPVFIDSSTTVRCTSVDVPLTMELGFPISRFKPYVFAGPGLEISLDTARRLWSSPLRSSEFFTSFGGGVQYDISYCLELLSEVRYSHYFTTSLKRSGANWESHDYKVIIGLTRH